MNAEIDKIKISMSWEDGEQLVKEFSTLEGEIKSLENYAMGYEAQKFQLSYPKINEFLSVLNLSNQLPF